MINRFLGYWDGNPANLIPLSPQDSAPLYVEMMGGSAKIMAKGRELQAQGKYLEPIEILNKLVFAEPRNQPARDLLADVYEQLGYQTESTSVRNSFLQGAFELRSGMPAGARAASDRAGRGPRDVDRACGSTSSASAWTRRGPRACASPSTSDARQRREVRWSS